tara:strand:+ start:3924 stop:5636 length:1713 start_codon:yes stop_codon:yes gene_type:complete
MSLYKDASLVMIPSAVKDGKLYSIRPTDGSGDFTFSRGSNLAATRVDVNGLIEKGRENLLKYSNDFSNGFWGSTYLNESGGQEGYDGTNNAWEIVVNTSRNYTILLQASNTSGVVTNSIYAKAGNSNFLGITDTAGQGSSNCIFDLTDGSISHQAGNDFIQTSSESVGGGWYRLKVTHKGTSPNYALWFVANAGNSTNGTAGDSVFIQNAQQESGLVATDYIETGASTAQAGILEDLPRLDYSGGASCPALLLEPQRSNKFLFSEYYGSGALGIYQTGTNTHSVTNNYAVSPEGVQNAIRFVADITSVGDRVVLRDGVSCGGGNHTLTFYAKSNTSDTYTMKMHFDGGGKKQIEVTPEWQRFEYGESANATCNAGIECSSASGYSPSVDISVYGFQLEENLYPTSYIPTYGSAVTRSKDTCLLNNSSALPTSYPFTLYSESIIKSIGSEFLMSFLNTSDNVSYASMYVSSGIPTLNARSGSSDVALASPDSVSEGSVKIVGVFESSTLKLFVNGALKATISNTTTFQSGWNDLLIGQLRTITDTGNRTTNRQALVFPTALTDSECIALTK